MDLYNATVIGDDRGNIVLQGDSYYDETGAGHSGGQLGFTVANKSSALFGVRVVNNWAAGTQLLCVRDTSTARGSLTVLGCCGDFTDIASKDRAAKIHRPLKTSDGADMAVLDGPMQTASEQLLLKTFASQPGTHLMYDDADMLPGDWSVRDNTGDCGITVGRHRVELYGSPLSYIEVAEIDRSITCVADNASLDTLTSEHVFTHYYEAHNTAYSLNESLGDVAAPGENRIVELDTSGNEPVIKETKEAGRLRPFYRLQRLDGAVADGRMSMVMAPVPERGAAHTIDEQSEPYVLSARRDSFSGKLSDASALGIMSAKTPMIPALHQLCYGGSPDSKHLNLDREDPELRVPCDDKAEAVPRDTASEKASLDERVRDAAINMLNEYLLSDDFTDTMTELLHEWGLKPANIKLMSGNISKKGTGRDPVVSGATSQQQYDLPRSIELTDPDTGLKHTYFASTSFISQEPSGDIIIADGYGSEIRMSRGNIYISPALDCFVRPGRDMSVMAGRHQSYDAQQTTSIHSVQSISIGSVKNVNICGGYASDSKDGVVSIRAKRTVDVESANVSIAGYNDIAIMRRQVPVETAGGEVISEASTYGGIFIDAGPGPLSVQSRLYTNKAESKVSFCAGTSSTASGVGISDNVVSVYTKQVQCPASLYMLPLGTPAVETFYDHATGKHQRCVLGTASKCQFMLNDTALIQGGLQVNGSAVVRKSLLGYTIASTQPGVGMLDASNITWQEPDTAKQLKPLEMFGYVLRNAAARITVKFSDRAELQNSFYFPEYGISSMVIPGMRWQQAGGTQYKWQAHSYYDPVAKKNMACYPGYDVWFGGDSSISVQGYRTLSPVTGNYTINAKA